MGKIAAVYQIRVTLREPDEARDEIAKAPTNDEVSDVVLDGFADSFPAFTANVTDVERVD